MSDTNIDREKMLERIRKLLALATSPNENEAALAASKAHAILAEYGFTMDEVEQQSKKGKLEEDDELEMRSNDWVRILVNTTADLYFCKMLYVNRAAKNRDKVIFIGARHNIEVAKLMSIYLVGTVIRLSREGRKEIPKSERSRYSTSFRVACTYRLLNRLAARKRKAMNTGIQTESGKNLPALRNMYLTVQDELEVYMMDAYPKAKDSKRSIMPINHQRGAADGHDAGGNISLDAQMESKTKENSAPLRMTLGDDAMAKKKKPQVLWHIGIGRGAWVAKEEGFTMKQEDAAVFTRDEAQRKLHYLHDTLRVLAARLIRAT